MIAQTPGQCEIEEKKIEEIIVGCSDRFDVLCNKNSYKSCCANMCFLQGRYKPPKKHFDGPCVSSLASSKEFFPRKRVASLPAKLAYLPPGP